MKFAKLILRPTNDIRFIMLESLSHKGISYANLVIKRCFHKHTASNSPTLSRNIQNMPYSSNKVTCKLRNYEINTYLKMCNNNIDRLGIRCSSNTTPLTQKADFKEQVDHQAMLNRKKAEKLDRFKLYHKRFQMHVIGILFTVGFCLIVFWFDPEQRKIASEKNPTWGKFVDEILGPPESKDSEKNNEKDTQKKVENVVKNSSDGETSNLKDMQIKVENNDKKSEN